MNSLALRDEHVSLPARYEAAKRALAECERIDECQDWANKAAALAVYAKQSKDDSLVIMAQRIQARAIRRCGELLLEVPAAQGVKDGSSRAAVGRAAGLSDSRQLFAARIAKIPAAEFERAVEADKPPSITTLARLDHGQQRRLRGCCPACGRPL